MAAAVLATGALRFKLAPDLRDDVSSWTVVVLLVILLAALIIGDPGRIDRESRWLRALTDVMISVITLVNAIAAFRLVLAIVNADPFTQNARVLLASGAAVWATNVIAFALWYWDLDRGGAAARARGSGPMPAFLFPEMVNEQHVEPGWYPTFVDYLHLSFSTAAEFSPTDVSAIKKWAKLVMMSESAIPRRGHPRGSASRQHPQVGTPPRPPRGACTGVACLRAKYSVLRRHKPTPRS